MRKIAYPFYMMLHPFKGLNQLKSEKQGLGIIAVLLLVMFFLSEMIARQFTSFSFNPLGGENVNVFYVLFGTVILVLLFVTANWCFCTLMQGEATFKELFIAVCFTLLPLIMMNLCITGISHVMSLEEEAFFSIFNIVKYTWFYAYLFVSVMIMQQYTFLKTIGSIILTLTGMAIMLFLMVLIFSLFQQLYMFLNTIYNELSLRW